MGIYRTLIEEEVPHLDDNNSPDDQFKDLRDVIEDQDANAAEQDAAQAAEFGPDCGVDDILDESAYAIYEFEAGHNAIIQAIGLQELRESCNGREFIFEAADVKGFFTSLGNKIKTFFTKVWQVIQRWAGNLKALCTRNKNFYEKFKKQIEAGRAIVVADKSRQKPKGYNFNVGEFKKDAPKPSAAKTAESKINSIESELDNANYNGIAGNDANRNFDASDMLEKVYADYAGKQGSISRDEFSKALKENNFGGTEATTIEWMSADEIKTALSNNWAEETDKMMKTIRDQMKDVKIQLKRMKDKAEKISDNDVARNKYLAICTKYFTFVRGYLTASETWRSARLSAISAYARQGRKHAMTYVAAANKDTHKGFQKESAEYGFLGALGLV